MGTGLLPQVCRNLHVENKKSLLIRRCRKVAGNIVMSYVDPGDPCNRAKQIDVKSLVSDEGLRREARKIGNTQGDGIEPRCQGL